MSKIERNVQSKKLLSCSCFAGCGNSGNSTKGLSDKGGQAGFEEVETFDLVGAFNSLNFSLDEDGSTLLWGENNGGLGDDLRRYVWVDGEVNELDIETFGQSSVLTPSGTVVVYKIDRETEAVDNKHSMLEYDPTTDKTEEFVAKSDYDDFLHPGHGTYMQDPRTYIHTVTNTIFDDSETYIWDVDNNEFTDLNFIHDIKEEVGEELRNYPHFFLSDDASKVYAIVMSTGIFAYDVEAGKTEDLLSTDSIMAGNKTTMLTSDGKHITYAADDSDDDNDFSIKYYALDVESKESIEIGNADSLFTLSDGNIIIIDENDVKYFNFETEELETIHTIEQNENQEIDNIAVSLDGSTIAYGSSEKDEDDKEWTTYMTILINK